LGGQARPRSTPGLGTPRCERSPNRATLFSTKQFGVSIGTLVVSAGLAYAYRKHIPTLVTAVVTMVLSAWTIIVASLIFSQSTVQNLAFAGSLAIAGLAVIGLTVNELSTESVARSLEASDGRRESGLAAAA
jgi:hypothetical protein